MTHKIVSTIVETMTKQRAFRAAQYAALGDQNRLAIVDALAVSDHTPSALMAITGLTSNLLTFHLNVLETAHIITRITSEGDRRRRYITLHENAPQFAGSTAHANETVLFVCTHNQARSQLAAALWQHHTGLPAHSAGVNPAAKPDPQAVTVAKHYGLDTNSWQTRGYSDITVTPTRVVTVCDRAFEQGVPFDTPIAHWSVADPAGQSRAAYEHAIGVLERRILRLVNTHQNAPS